MIEHKNGGSLSSRTSERYVAFFISTDKGCGPSHVDITADIAVRAKYVFMKAERRDCIYGRTIVYNGPVV